MTKNENTRPAGGTAERAAAEMTACRASIPMSDCNTAAADRQIKISAFLSHGQENAIPRRELEKLTGMDGRTVRLMIEQERRGGTPICTNNLTGYYLQATEEERTACVRSMRHRAGEIMKTARAIEQAEG